MSKIIYLTHKSLDDLRLQQIAMQEELLEVQRKALQAQQEALEAQRQLNDAQNRIIELQNRISEMTPKNPADQELSWYSVSGTFATEVAKSNDIEELQAFREWIFQLAEKHVKPYVNAKVYREVVNQMTRGLAERISTLRMDAEFGNDEPEERIEIGKRARSSSDPSTDAPQSKIIQYPLALFQNA